MSKDIAISLKNVSKDFLLPHEKLSSIKSSVISVFKRKNRQMEVQHALKDISFEIKKGEFFGIVGRNGSGKSTLLKIIAEIYKPTEGSVKRNGKLVPFIELGVGFNPELTGRENVFLNGAMLGFSKKEVQQMYDDIVKFAELEKFMDQKLKNYSSGMQVRLAFSVAIKADAEILVIDEVLAVGDADFQRKCFEYFKELKHNKKTVIFVSHDMGAIQQYCDRVALIDNSKLVEIGKANKVSTMYSKLFLDNTGTSNTKLSVSGEERWGDNWAQWKRIGVEVNKKKNNGEVESYRVKATGVSHKEIEHPIFGFSIKNDTFTQLLGTNTVRRLEDMDTIQAGETFTIEWVIPNIFNVGMHYVDCTIAHDQASFVSDRWPEATSFKVNRIENNPYPVYSDTIKFELKKG